MKLVRRCRYQGVPRARLGQRVAMAVVHAAAIADAVVFFVTLGFVSSKLHEATLFSEFVDRLSKG